METIAVGFWGGYFGTVLLMLAGSAYAFVRGLRRIGANAALSALASAFFVVAFLGWLPIEDRVANDRFLAHVATLVASLLVYMLLSMLGLLRQPSAARRARAALAGLTAAVLLVGWVLPSDQALVLSVVISTAMGVVALGVAVRNARRGERLTWAAVAAVFFMLVALSGLSWSAVTQGRVHWGLHAVSALAAMGYMAIIAAVLWGRFSYLIELRQVMAYGPAYDPVTRMRSHAETGQMVGAAFYRHEGEALAVGVIALTISNLYALEKLHGRAAVNHALFVCAGRLRRSMPGWVEMGRLGDDGFLLLVRDMREPDRLIQLSRAVVSRLSRPVNLDTSRDAALPAEGETQWVADLGVGVLAAAHPNIRAASAVSMARAMSRTAWSYASRIAWFDQAAGRIAELPGAEAT
ncbi:MAG: GGDEF domain-containing protein [Ramlibacter sp.]|nr:GGDEF domain-containing protein [Ramlibacter sp.]